VDPVSARNSLTALRVVDVRSNLLRAGEVLDDAALDKYSFTRDVFLQVRSQRAAEAAGKELLQNGDSGMLPPEPEQ